MRTVMRDRSAKWKDQCKAWWKKNWVLKRWYAMKKNYGPGAPEHYKAQLEKQKGKCAVCGKKMDKPHFDHNHFTSQFRGLLCAGCNMRVGVAEHPLFKATLKYLKSWRSK